ncbi:DUF2878 domain-containing protein [Neptunicella sp. SCSIO 80796]|uniref:DUF2878 domain-containing protein n=1 Tax=Neptunicella plasticusilytica TaxID=3117012 RepID=UPI003A4DD63D
MSNQANTDTRQHAWSDLVINALLFQVIWFIAIFGPWYLAVVPLLLLLWHYIKTSQSRFIDSMMLLVVSTYGLAVDSLMSLVGLFEFDPQQALFANAIPLFLPILWLAFAMTIHRSLYWLVNKSGWFILLCVSIGPLSYVAARSASAVVFDHQTLIFIVIEWLSIGFLCVGLNHYVDSGDSNDRR